MTEPRDRFLQAALVLAEENARSGRGGPFGAVVVKDGEIVAEGVNLVTGGNDPTAHAEIMAIREACRRLNTFDLSGCELYASCEPCPMCLGAVYWARLDRLVYAATRQDAATAGFDDALIYDEISLAPRDRSLTTIQMAHPGRGLPFAAWAALADRREY
jgi:tRNA(Arg) A34 adenosine deaminase TadA